MGGREACPLLVRLPLASCSDGNVPPESRLEMLQPLDWGFGLPFPQTSPIPVACGHFSVSVQGGSTARRCPLPSLGFLVPTGPTCPVGHQAYSSWAPWHEIVLGSLTSGRSGFRSPVSGPTGHVTMCESCTIPAPASSSVKQRLDPCSERAGVRTTWKQRAPYSVGHVLYAPHLTVTT